MVKERRKEGENVGQIAEEISMAVLAAGRRKMGIKEEKERRDKIVGDVVGEDEVGGGRDDCSEQPCLQSLSAVRWLGVMRRALLVPWACAFGGRRPGAAEVLQSGFSLRGHVKQSRANHDLTKLRRSNHV